MITETGKNLSVLIVTEPEKDWQTFATWYSVFKNLPEARTAIFCQRNKQTPFVLYQWAKRLKIPTMIKNPFTTDASEQINWLHAIRVAVEEKLVSDTLLVLRPLAMALESFDRKLLSRLNETNLWIDEDAWFMRRPDLAAMMDAYYLEEKHVQKSTERLCLDAKEESNLASLVSYKKGCGRWIDTSKGCPFSSAAGLVSTEMTVNETRIVELWKKMVPLFNAVV